jgi:hypothetical protein
MQSAVGSALELQRCLGIWLLVFAAPIEVFLKEWVELIAPRSVILRSRQTGISQATAFGRAGPNRQRPREQQAAVQIEVVSS